MGWNRAGAGTTNDPQESIVRQNKIFGNEEDGEENATTRP
jgi:hypothetical protein